MSCKAQSSRLNYPDYIRYNGTNYEVPHCGAFSTFLEPKYSPQDPVFKYPLPVFLPSFAIYNNEHVLLPIWLRVVW